MGSTAAPTRARHVVLLFLCGLMFVLYLDRICIGQAGPSIKDDLQLTDPQLGWVFAAFTVAYGLFEVITGHWGDRFGPRKVITRIVLWWSAFTALTGAANSFSALLVIRFLFGAGEAGALPNAVRVTETWFPASSRGFVRGTVMMAAMTGGVIAPPVTAHLIDGVGWRAAFGVYGLLGVAWAAAFWAWFRDRPADHPAVNDAERALIGPPRPPAEHGYIPWREAFAHPTVWCLGGAMVTGAATVYVLFSWFPDYLVNTRGLAGTTAGYLTGLVMGGGAVGCIVGGWLADRANRRFAGTRWTRAVVGAGGFGLAAAAMAAGVLLADWPVAMAGCFAVACFGVNAHGGAIWGAAADLGGANVGVVFGAINSLGVFGAATAQLGFGYVPAGYRTVAFAGCAASLVFGAAFWALADTRRPVEVDPRKVGG